MKNIARIRMDNLIKTLTADSIDRAYLISALEFYSKMVIADESDWGQSIVNKTLWQTCARNTLDTLNQYGGKEV